MHPGSAQPVPSRAAGPVVDKSFDYGITCVFENLAGHNAYQVHPLHLAFVNTGKPLWARVQIYDAE